VKGDRVDETRIGEAGECRRMPPAESFRWPKVKDVDWCGEFAESEKVKVKSEKCEERAPVKKRARRRKPKTATPDNEELRL
jgi:hypothetical protein